MHVYKLQARTFGEKEIVRTEFERDTRKLEPWYQVTGDKQREYAVCPACDNPVRLVGLYEDFPIQTVLMAVTPASLSPGLTISMLRILNGALMSGKTRARAAPASAALKAFLSRFSALF